MIYTSYNDLSDCIRRNIWKVPADIGLIVGVPRSGMLAALMVAELMNRRCVDIDSFISGRTMQCGGRGSFINGGKENKVLVIDDTVNSGNSMRKVRKNLSSLTQYDFVFACVYAEGPKAKDMVDLWFEDVWRKGETKWFYEWNILHHYEGNTRCFMFDIDGLLCKEPPDERIPDAYRLYLPDAIPMVIPTTFIGALVTYRLEKYRDITERWLEKYGVTYGQLFMYDADSYEIRNSAESPACYKARLFKKATWAILFLESSAGQAEQIHRMTGKPVFCYENGKMYGNG